MATKTTEVKGLNAKIMKLREAMNAFTWEKDGKNRHQGYSYITEKQYKNNFKAALTTAELDFKCEEVEREFIGAISDKMHLMFVKFKFSLIDRDSGEKEEYVCSGSGADNSDKAIYKAYTGAIKYFLANNFLVAEDEDPESDDKEVREEKPKYTSPEKRELIKEKITQSDNGPATEEQLESIKLGVELLMEAGDEENAKIYAEAYESALTKVEAETLIEALAELVGDDNAA